MQGLHFMGCLVITKLKGKIDEKKDRSDESLFGLQSRILLFNFAKT